MKKIKLFRPFIVIVAVLQLLGACNISKDAMVPDVKPPAVYRDAPADTANVGKMPWASFFSDPELKALITKAIEHNNDLQIALKDIEAASLELKQARLGNLPTVAVQANASYDRFSDNSLNGLFFAPLLNAKHVEDYTLAASLAWEADLWGKIKSQKAGALAGYLQTAEARKAVQTRVVSDIAKGYYNLLLLDAQLEIAKINVHLNDSTLAIIHLQYRSGQVTSLAVQQAEAQKLAAAGLIPQFEQQIVAQENAISILSGENPSAIQRHGSLASITRPEKLDAGVPADLLSRRPDVRVAELELSRANAEVGYARANMYPSLSITAQGGLDAIKASNWFNLPASLFGIIGGG